MGLAADIPPRREAWPVEQVVGTDGGWEGSPRETAGGGEEVKVAVERQKRISTRRWMWRMRKT